MNIVQELVIILSAAFLGGFLAQKVRVPLVVGYLTTGVIFSWFLGKWISLSQISSIADIGVAFLMFTLGLEFSLSRLKKLGEIIILGSLIQIFLTILISLFVFPLLGFDYYNSLFLGAALSLSSTAVVVKILSDRGELDTLSGEIAVGWLLIQDIATLPLIILLPTLGGLVSFGGGFLWSIVSLVKALSLSFLAIFLILILGRKIIPKLLDKVAQSGMRELLLIAVVTLCLFFASLFSYLGFSFPLGAFIAGMILATTSGNHAIFAEVRPLRDVFSIVFFVSLGFLLKGEFVLSHIVFILILTLAVILFKFLINAILVISLGYHSRTAFKVGIALVSIGEFAFILARLGQDRHIISEGTYMTILSVALLSLVISSPLITYGDSLYRMVKNFLTKRFPAVSTIWEHFDRDRNSPEFDKANHVVLLGHGRVGKYVAKALSVSGIPYVVVDYNNHLVKHLRFMGTDVIYGDPAEIDVLRFAKLAKAKAVIVAIPDRNTQDMAIINSISLNPAIKIICRSHYEEDRIRLKSLGVFEVVQPEFEAAISITQKLLMLFEIPTLEINERIKRLKLEHNL